MRSLVGVLSVVLVVCGSVSAHTWYIKPDGTGDVPTIQAGLGSAASGDTLLLSDGVFSGPGNYDINVMVQNVRIFSASQNAAACVVDCSGSQWYCLCFGGYDGQFRCGSGTVRGLTVTNANAAIKAWVASSAQVEHCHFVGNSGTAVAATGMTGHGYGSVVVRDCYFGSNAQAAMGVQYKCGISAIGCVFYQNGYVLMVGAGGAAALSRCTVVGNYGGAQGVFRGAGGGSWLNISGCIVAFNTGTPFDCNVATLDLSCTDIWGNTDGDFAGCAAGLDGVAGNFSADPLFCDRPGGDLGLQAESPCLAGGHPSGANCGTIGALESVCGNATEPTTWGAIKSMFRQ